MKMVTDFVLTDETAFPKLSCMFIFTFSSLILGLLPLAVHKRFLPAYWFGHDKFIGQLSGFGGGVLFSIVFLYLLPEIRKCVDNLETIKHSVYGEFLPELLMCIGFLILYVSEECAHNFIVSLYEVKRGTDVEIAERVNRDVTGAENGIINEGFECWEFIDSTPVQVNSDPAAHATEDDRTRSPRILSTSSIPSVELTMAVYDTPAVNGVVSARSMFLETLEENFLLILALSVHSAFEGFAIGLQTESVAVWYMTVGIGIHKLIIAFCVGIQMLSIKKQLFTAVLFVVTFSVTTSAGVAVGMCISTGDVLTTVVLQGLTSGSLLYVVFEMIKPDSSCSPCFGAPSGFILMALVIYFVPE